MSEPSRPTTPFARLVNRLLFVFYILYCVEAGIFLAWAPWTDFWTRTFVALPWGDFGPWLLDPWVRGAVTGFGLIHLVWGLHDLEAWFSRGGRRRKRNSADSADRLPEKGSPVRSARLAPAEARLQEVPSRDTPSRTAPSPEAAPREARREQIPS